MKAIMFIVVEASVAAGGPTGVAYQIHQIVRAFHSTNASVAQPNMPHHERRVSSYDALTHSIVRVVSSEKESYFCRTWN